MDTRKYHSLFLITFFLLFSSLGYIPGIILIGILAFASRIYSVYTIFFTQKPILIDIFESFVSHIILFASVYMLFKTEYTTFEPSGDAVDSLYYSIDTIVTNGAARVIPATTKTISIHLVNLIDSYLLLTTIGFFIVKNLKISLNI